MAAGGIGALIDRIRGVIIVKGVPLEHHQTDCEVMSIASTAEGPISPRDVIEHIRRYEFGIGAELVGDGREVVDRLVRKYRNLLETVAKDLNSKESHFLLELVQNADDNHYALDVEPALSFQLGPGELVVSNNEVGFTPANVRALCSAGESSKKNKVGYIGEKGIGFKSVFKVTDTPEIHSNGYHFRFDLTAPEDPLGYVVPHWIDTRADDVDEETTVVLPARAGNDFSPALLTDINATLLLFLEKLRLLKVHTNDFSVRYERADDESLSALTVVSERPGQAESRELSMYLRSKFSLDMSDIVEPKREKVEHVNVVLAFPLSADGAAAPVEGCPTYAFLPIREFGFSFYIQADFVLTSSREGIHEELPWNRRLRDSIAPAFVATVEEFKAYPALSLSYLRFLPGKNDVVDPFFAPVVAQTVDALKEVACIPVEGGGWRKPAEVLLASDAIRRLFSWADAVALFGADYPTPDFVAPEGGLERLSCRKLLIAEVLEIFGKHSEWLKDKDLEWKVQFYEYIAKSPRRADYVEGMLKLPCIPAAGGSMATPEGDAVFYPLNSTETYGFEHMLTVVDSEFHARATDTAPDVLALLDSLGVQHDKPYELIQRHVLPHHTPDGFKKADPAALLGHIRYLRDKLDAYLAKAREGQPEATALEALRTGLYLGSKREEDGVWFFERPSSIYLSKEYHPDFNIEGLLGDKLPTGKLLSEKYILKPTGKLDKDETATDLQRWREFFIRIGVHETPMVVSQTTGDAVCSDELSALLQAEDQMVRRVTLECLNKHWVRYDGLTIHQARYGKATTQTQFGTALRETTAPTRRRVTVPLEQTYHDCSEVRDLLGGNLTYVDADVWDECFLAACGITYKIDAKACIKRLRQIRTDGGSTREQIRRIYRQLEKLWNIDGATIQAAFTNETLIAIGRGGSLTWVLLGDACWRPTGVRFLDARHPPLNTHYVDYTNFFTRLLHVPLELELAKWVAALAELETVESESERADIAIVIYRRLSRELTALSSTNPLSPQPTWMERMKTQPLFLNHRGKLVANSASLYFNDAPEYAALFKDLLHVSLLAIAPEQLSAVTQLLTRLGVETLSASLKVAVVPGIRGTTDEQLTQKLRSMFMCLARVVYTQSHERFETAIRDKLFEALHGLEVVIVQDLALDVTLGASVRRTTGPVARRGAELLLNAEAPSHLDQVALEVRKLLRLPVVFTDIISRVLISPTVQDAEVYLRLRNVSALPPEEELALARALGLEPPAPATLPASEGWDAEAKTTAPPASPSAALRPPSGSGQDKNSAPPPNAATGGAGLPAGPLDGSPSPEATGGNLPWSDSTASPAPAPSPTPPAGAVGGNGGASGVAHKPDGSASHAPYGELAPVRLGTGTPSGGSHAGRRGRKSRPAQMKRGRLLSYADTSDQTKPSVSPDAEPDPEAAKRNRTVEQAAVKYFLEKAASQWKFVEVMPPGNPGFDIKALTVDGREEYIEVKGLGGAWTEAGVALTPTELAKANSARGRYWLCVVEYATDDNRRQLFLVQDPFGLTTQFRFDKGWKAIAKTVAARPQRPEVGMFVTIVNEGKGRITKVKGGGQLAKLHIEFEGGRQSFSKVFNPATMTLSYE